MASERFSCDSCPATCIADTSDGWVQTRTGLILLRRYCPYCWANRMASVSTPAPGEKGEG
jgi:hypothetical protein